MKGRFWRRDSIARRFILTVVTVVVCTLALVALFLSFGGIWAAPPIEKTGLLERAVEFYRIINAAFCHPAPSGSRFNSADRGAWYAAFELPTAQAEVAYHRQLWLKETAWEEEDESDYQDYLADFRAGLHDLREHDLRATPEHADCLSPTSYKASQALAAKLLELGSAGIVYPCVRRRGGTCLVCFRPVLVTNVRKSYLYTFIFPDYKTPPKIRRG